MLIYVTFRCTCKGLNFIPSNISSFCAFQTHHSIHFPLPRSKVQPQTYRMPAICFNPFTFLRIFNRKANDPLKISQRAKDASNTCAFKKIFFLIFRHFLSSLCRCGAQFSENIIRCISKIYVSYIMRNNNDLVAEGMD
jgi:hypothetical protein